MSLTPRVYKSTDTSAPVLTGQAGSLTALLDAVLVDGYGTGPDYKAPAGWTREFTASNKRVFRNSPVTGSGTYLRIDDTGSVGNARHASLRVYSSMSDIDTGTDETPTVAQLANGTMWVKSSTLNSTARIWMIVACERWIYFFMAPANDGVGLFANVPYAPFFAGDFNSLVPGDNFNFALTGTNVSTYTGATISACGPFGGFSATFNIANSSTIRSSRAHILRSYDGSTASVITGPVLPGDRYGPSADYFGAGTGTGRPLGPNPITGGYDFVRIGLIEGDSLVRGYLPNVYGPVQNKPFTHGVVLTGMSGFPIGTELLPWFWSSWWATPTTTWSEVGMVVFDLTSEDLTP